MKPQLLTKSAAETADVNAIMQAIETRDAAMAARLTNSEAGVEEANARLFDLEQKAARRGGGEPSREQTWGEQFVEGIDLAGFRDNVQRRKQSEGLLMKTTLTSASASGGSLVAPYRDEPVMLPRRRLRIRDLIPTIQISSGAVEYPKQTARPSAAGMVPETQLKPESAMAFEMLTTAAKVIAHWIPASRQILDDAPQLAGMIDSDLRYGLELKEDEQILTGSGTGENLYGLIPQATDYVAPFAVGLGETIIDKVGLAVLQAALTDFPPDGIVLHPTDWMRIRLTKDADGRYIFGNPATSNTAALWGLPVVETTSMPVGSFLVGSFQAAATIYDRWLPRVEISTEHADFFVRNLVAILAEERLAFAVKNPNAIIYGTFAAE